MESRDIDKMASDIIHNLDLILYRDLEIYLEDGGEYWFGRLTNSQEINNVIKRIIERYIDR